MAAKTWSQTTSASGVDELLFQNDTVSLCLLVNRRHRTLRVIDFRAGPTAAKRNFVIATAKREGVEKVFALVERDEVSTWTRLGFRREGAIPSFYKRSDAWILGAVVAEVAPLRGDARGADEDDEDEAGVREASPAEALAERTLARAKKLVKDVASPAAPAVRLAAVREADARKAVTAAQRKGRALTGFEPFGRDASRTYRLASARGGFELWASIEVQSCFGNSLFELLTAPRTEPERLATLGAVRALTAELVADGAVSTFTVAPADDALLASVYVAAGFRRTGVLASHLVVGGERKDAIVWSKKLVTPADA
jgi:hypothetical protein